MSCRSSIDTGRYWQPPSPAEANSTSCEKHLHSSLYSVLGLNKVFNVMKSKVMKPRLLYPARLSFKLKGEIKTFTYTKRLRVHYHHTCIARNAKGTVVMRISKERNIGIYN